MLIRKSGRGKPRLTLESTIFMIVDEGLLNSLRAPHEEIDHSGGGKKEKSSAKRSNLCNCSPLNKYLVASYFLFAFTMSF